MLVPSSTVRFSSRSLWRTIAWGETLSRPDSHRSSAMPSPRPTWTGCWRYHTNIRPFHLFVKLTLHAIEELTSEAHLFCSSRSAASAWEECGTWKAQCSHDSRGRSPRDPVNRKHKQQNHFSVSCRLYGKDEADTQISHCPQLEKTGFGGQKGSPAALGHCFCLPSQTRSWA